MPGICLGYQAFTSEARVQDPAPHPLFLQYAYFMPVLQAYSYFIPTLCLAYASNMPAFRCIPEVLST